MNDNKSADPRGTLLVDVVRHGHRFEVFNDAPDDTGLTIHGYYDGTKSVAADAVHTALIGLFRKHFGKRLEGTVITMADVLRKRAANAAAKKKDGG